MAVAGKHPPAVPEKPSDRSRLGRDLTTTSHTPRLTAYLAIAAPEPAFAADRRGRGLFSDPSRHRPACRPSAVVHPLHAGLR